MKIIGKIFKELKGRYVINSKVDKKAYLSSGTMLYNSFIDKFSYTGYDCEIINAKIGKFCSISNEVIIGGPSHPLNFVSTSPVFLSGKNCLKKHFSYLDFNPYTQTIIENDVWIGERSIIKAGVTLGNGCVVGAGSVVTHDIPPYEVWAGNPARFIKKRFSDFEIKKLLEIKWWDSEENDIKKYCQKFDDIDFFIKEVDNK